MRVREGSEGGIDRMILIVIYVRLFQVDLLSLASEAEASQGILHGPKYPVNSAIIIPMCV